MQRRILLTAGLAAGLSLVALPAMAGARADDAPVTLRYAPKAGNSARYQTTQMTSAMGMDIVVTVTAKRTIKEVRDDGGFAIENAPQTVKLNIGGAEQDGQAGPPQVQTYDRQGRLTDFKREQGEDIVSLDIARLLATVGMPIFSDKAVKPGGAWQVELDNPAAKGKKFTVKGTYLGMEKVGDVDCWKIRESAEAETGGDNKLTNEYTAWLNPATGQLQQLEGELKNVPTNFGPLSFKIKTALMP
jgi:hypothetical protein